MQQFIVREQESGRRLDAYIKKILPDASTSFVYKMLRKKNITVNRKKADGDTRLNSGDSVEMFFADETFKKLSGGISYDDTQQGSVSGSIDVSVYHKAYDSLKGIDIVYEDSDFIFVNKPTGILSQKATSADLSLNEWLIGYLLKNGEIKETDIITFKPAFANRLDRNTRGLVLGAKTLGGLRLLSDLLKTRDLGKYYVADVVGSPDDKFPVVMDSFWDSYAYLVKDKKNNQVYIFDTKEDADANSKGNAKPSPIHTGFRLLSSDSSSMKIEVDLHTGKSHQIRAHLAHLGHPIVGDPKYGDGKRSFQELKAYRVVFPIVDNYPSISGKEFTC